jgi:hypothetical protein
MIPKSVATRKSEMFYKKSPKKPEIYGKSLISSKLLIFGLSKPKFPHLWVKQDLPSKFQILKSSGGFNQFGTT